MFERIRDHARPNGERGVDERDEWTGHYTRVKSHVIASEKPFSKMFRELSTSENPGPKEVSVLDALAVFTQVEHGSHPVWATRSLFMENLAQCVTLLRASTDEQRFVGLLLAAKLMRTPADLALVFEEGMTFVRRLLLTPPSTGEDRKSTRLNSSHP